MIRLCSYNIHSAVGGVDKQYNPRRIAEVLSDIRADICGLQEVRCPPDKSGILDILERERGMKTLFLKTMTDRYGGYGNALVSCFPILEHKDINLETNAVRIAKTPKSEARRAIAARFYIEDWDSDLWVVSTHLAVQRSARRLQSEKLIGVLHEFLDIDKVPCVLMGDMNEWLFPVHFIRQLDGLFGKHVSRRTFPALCPVLPLDRMWLSRRLKPATVRAYRGTFSRTASDHLPIYADIDYNPVVKKAA